MRDIPFIHVRSDGRSNAMSIPMDDDVATLAEAVLSVGYRFEVDVLSNGSFAVFVCDIPRGKSVAVETCSGDPASVRAAVEKLIRRYAQKSGAV